MLKYLLLTSFFFTCGTGYSQAEVDSNKVIRVLTLNILHGATTNGDFDLDAIAKVIIEARPDFVALQEVDFKTRRAKGYDLATELGWRAKLQSLFGRAMKYDGGEYGEGVLSGFTLLSSKNHALPHSPENEPRAALEVMTETASGDTVVFIGTHLDHVSDDTDRVAQATAINSIFSGGKHPMILAGDLNDVPGSKTINIFESMWEASYREGYGFGIPRPTPASVLQQHAANTYPSDAPVKKIDYVLFYPHHRWRVLQNYPICDAVASDHCGYLVVLELVD
ncbi:endonuclease/exonuclease/phosphatase family protein [Neolewinella persica]|uniref:endonuclease/exonuclease/phosphatase family protein n=1 Tax=Neolewinella persica TaxID=70998 RepID=UPI00037528FC|nr:endonuclease/exonuclease/phosphatase family protein [Neolewinella persica]